MPSTVMMKIKPNSTTQLLDLFISLIALLSHGVSYGTEDCKAGSSITVNYQSQALISSTTLNLPASLRVSRKTERA